MKKISIIGSRGIPAEHGGFETFAEYLSLYLVKKGWDVIIYCQQDSLSHGECYQDEWHGVKRFNIPITRTGAAGTIEFDWKSVIHSINNRDRLLLTLGYNTAIFSLLQRVFRIKNIINMDGIEWRRDKWKIHERAWLWLNERAGCFLGNHLIADHPKIKEHLATRVSENKITMIPYGGRSVSMADPSLLEKYGLEKDKYFCVIARPEPENSILEIVRAFSRKRRNTKLIVLGVYNSDKNDFHKRVLEAASDEVVFTGAIYDKPSLDAIRFFSLAYIHGHRVGGTNPSLVEALGAGSAVIAHDNHFNRWVAGVGACYFSDVDSCDEALSYLLSNIKSVEEMRVHSRSRFINTFTWEIILPQYERVFLDWV